MTLNHRNMLQSILQIRLCYRLLLVNYRSAVLILMSGTNLLAKCLPERIKRVATHLHCTFLTFVALLIMLLGVGVIHENWSVSTAHNVGVIICGCRVEHAHCLPCYQPASLTPRQQLQLTSNKDHKNIYPELHSKTNVKETQQNAITLSLLTWRIW